MDVKPLHVQSVAYPRMRTLVLQTMDFQSIVVDAAENHFRGRNQTNVIGTSTLPYQDRVLYISHR